MNTTLKQKLPRLAVVLVALLLGGAMIWIQVATSHYQRELTARELNSVRTIDEVRVAFNRVVNCDDGGESCAAGGVSSQRNSIFSQELKKENRALYQQWMQQKN